MRISDWSSDVCSSDLHAERQRSTIKLDKATPSSEIHGNLPADEGQHTTHYSIVDAKGNAVSVTYTINYLFGVAKMAGDTGFFLNNEMDDFTSKRSEEHTSELQSLMRTSYAVFCLKKKTNKQVQETM